MFKKFSLFTKILIIVFIVVFLSILTLTQLPHPSINDNARKIGCVGNLHYVASVVETYENDFKIDIGKALSTITYHDELDLNKRFLLFLINQGWNFDTRSLKSFLKQSKVDPWGEKFNISYSTNLNYCTESLSNFLCKCPIVIWSNGPNRQNEQCGGDDIPWPIYYTNNVRGLPNFLNYFLKELKGGSKSKTDHDEPVKSETEKDSNESESSE
ncbi:MAG: hypothetical protein M0Q48_01250 [Verrucomicrobia bacterium]|nr:hypothetical protein [Verrucomicrobiota bacterium]